MGEEAAPDTQGGIGADPTEACEEVALPGVYGLLCLIGAVVFWRAYMEVYAVRPEKRFRALGHSLSIQSAVGLRQRSRRYLVSRVCDLTNSEFVLFFSGLVRMALLV